MKFKHQITMKPNMLNGAWLRKKCTCAGKDVAQQGLQTADILVVNGNVMFRNKILNRYCSYYEEAMVNSIGNDVFEITTISERSFSPSENSCYILDGTPKRTWKVLSFKPTEIVFESTIGCANESMLCTYKPLDHYPE